MLGSALGGLVRTPYAFSCKSILFCVLDAGLSILLKAMFHETCSQTSSALAQIAVPISLLQEQVAQLDPQADNKVRYTGLAGGQVPSEKEYRPERYSLREQDAAAAVIASMEDSLRHSPGSDA